MTRELDPEIQDVLGVLEDPGVPEIHEVLVGEARERFERLFEMEGERDEVDVVREEAVSRADEGDVGVRIYRPETGGGRALVWFHGGGFVLGSLRHRGPIGAGSL